MVTELWVHEKIRRQGVAHALMAVAKEQAVLEHRRAIILETQFCNVGAICYSKAWLKRAENEQAKEILTF